MNKKLPEEISFGEWLHQRRRMLDLTQQELADQAGCARITLRRIESGGLRPSKELALILLEKLGAPQTEREAWLGFARGLSGFPEQSIDSFASKLLTNLPAPLSSFIGREKELNEITSLVEKNRLVTLTGAGGIGKTRLSIQVASGLLNDHLNGIWLVELAPLSDPALVPQAIVNTLGLIEQANRPPQTILTDFLQGKHALLILDNCEHLIQACASLGETLLRACPDLHILATSREALGIPGETIYLVPSLTTPDALYAILESLPDYEAVQLFVERAQTAIPAFSITSDNALAIGEICRQLDGIPLALELAAARVKVLRVEEIATRLDDRFRLLTSGARTALPRHQTLEAMIDWSYDLLTEPERVLLRRLSVFAGGWTLEAAESICTDDAFEKYKILDLLMQLVNKSLILVKREQGQETRYQMLETIRQYGGEKLWAAGEGELIRQQHLTYFVDLAERAEPNLRAFNMVMWLDRLEAELDNIRLALEWAQESDVEAQLRLASALFWFWWIRGHRYEGVDWLERGLSIEAMERGVQPLMPRRALIRGKALNASGFLIDPISEGGRAIERLEESLALFQDLGTAGKQGSAYALLRLGGATSDNKRARSLLESSLALFYEVGDKFGISQCLMYLASHAQADGDYKQAIILTEEQLKLRKEIGDQDGIATALGILGDLAFAQNDYQRVNTLHEESLAIFRDVGNKGMIGFRLSILGDVFLWQRDYKRATEIYEEAQAFAKAVSDRFLIAFSLYNLGAIAWFQGDFVRATQLITDGLAGFREGGHHWLTASSLHALGDIALAQGDDKSAAQWYESELALARETHLEMSLFFALGGLGKVAWAQGDYNLAKSRFEEGLRISRESNLKHGTFHALYGLGRVAQSQGEYTTARAYYVEMLQMQPQRIRSPFRWNWLKTYVCAIAYPIAALAVVAVAHNQMKRAACLFSASEKLYPPLHFEISAKERGEHDQAVSAARAALGEEALSNVYEESKKMTLEKGISLALSED